MAIRAIDWYMTYQFMKRLVMPFTSWPAFKTGVIDENGNVIVPKDQRNPAQLNSWDLFDVVIANLKKLLAKIPGGSSKIASMAAAAWLMRESLEPTIDLSNEQLVEEHFLAYYNMVCEDAVPTNAVGGGNVAGVGVGSQGEPGGKSAVLKMLKRKKLNVGTTTSS